MNNEKSEKKFTMGFDYRYKRKIIGISAAPRNMWAVYGGSSPARDLVFGLALYEEIAIRVKNMGTKEERVIGEEPPINMVCPLVKGSFGHLELAVDFADYQGFEIDGVDEYQDVTPAPVDAPSLL